MLEFNGLYFTKLGNALADGHTGFYQMNGSKGIHLYKPDGKLEAYIVNNSRQGQFVVSAATTPQGNVYMHSTSSLTERWLEIDKISLLRLVNLIETMTVAERSNQLMQS